MLQRHEADLSVSAVTITYSRVSVIDFTLPFMHLGIAILMTKNTEEVQRSSTLFTFLEPLSFYVWIALAAAYLTVACTMWLLAKLSPYEWCVNACVSRSWILQLYIVGMTTSSASREREAQQGEMREEV